MDRFRHFLFHFTEHFIRTGLSSVLFPSQHSRYEASFWVTTSVSLSRRGQESNKSSVNQYGLIGNFSTRAQLLSVADPVGEEPRLVPLHTQTSTNILIMLCPESDFLFSQGLGLTPSARLNFKQKKPELTTSTFASPGERSHGFDSFNASCDNSPVTAFRSLLRGPLSFSVIFYRIIRWLSADG